MQYSDTALGHKLLPTSGTCNSTMSDISSTLPVPPSVLIAAGCCAAAMIYYQTTRKTNKDIIPQVPGYPIVGNAFDINPDDFHGSVKKLAAKYGSNFYVDIFSQKILLMSEAGLCRELQQKRPKTLVPGRLFEYMAKALGYNPYGLFHTTDAVIWSKMRKQTAPAFSKQNITSMSRDMVEEALGLVQRLNGRIEGGEVLDMISEISGYTVRILNRAAFGSDQVDYFLSAQFSKDARTTLNVLNESALFPFPPWVWKLSPGYKRELVAREADARFSTGCQQVIDFKRKQLATMSEEEKKNTHCMLDIMLRQEDARDEELLSNVKTFYLAGSDSAAMQLCWAMYMLSQHPAVVDKLRREVAGFFTADPLSRSVTEVSEALAAMVYTHAVLKEAMRVFPPATIAVMDFATNESITLSNGAVITPDTTIIMNFWLPMIDEANFVDSKSFKPERWLTEDKEVMARMERAFLGFGGGPRVCPGQGLAVAETAVALAAVYHHFDVELLCPPEEIHAELKFSLQPNKLPIKLTRRAGISVDSRK